MTFDAVVFDLYGTLVYEFPRAEFFAVVAEMADVLGAPADAFRSGWESSAIGRQTGVYATIEDNVIAICTSLGVEVRQDALARALDVRMGLYRRHFRPRPEAVATLEAISARGLPLALVSMCAPDTPALWRSSDLAGFFGVEVFSSEVGLRKPDAAIYLLAAERLVVAPAACLYVGDGSYGELSGAAAIGMSPVLIRDPAENPNDVLRPESEEWAGPTIASLAEVAGLLDAR